MERGWNFGELAGTAECPQLRKRISTDGCERLLGNLIPDRFRLHLIHLWRGRICWVTACATALVSYARPNRLHVGLGSKCMSLLVVMRSGKAGMRNRAK